MKDATSVRFDWYEATADADHDFRLPGRLTIALAGSVARRGKGRNGYAECVELVRGEDVLAQVYGRSARPGEVHVTITSSACDEVVPVLRRLLPDHRVSRADAAVDYVADFDTLDALALDFAQRRNISYRLVTDSSGGATRYLGATSSEVMVRVYRKTEQLRSQHPDRAESVPDGLVRFEVQVRPGKRDTKELVARMAAPDVWGMSKWSRDFAAEVVGGIDAERTPTHFRKPSSFSRSLHFLGIQYGPVIQSRAVEVGRAQALAELATALGL